MELKLAQGFAVEVEAAAGDKPRRTITGIAVPYNVAATVTDGTTVKFTAGSLPTDGKAPKLFMYHDSTQPVGLVTGRTDTADGMLFTASVVETQAGDEALTLAKAGVLDSVSVGVNAKEFYRDDDGTLVITAAEWVELSLVPVPAFSGASITDVAAAQGEADTAPDAELELSESVEEEPVSEEIAVEAAGPEQIVPTVFAQPKRKFDLPTAGEYLAALHIGGETLRNVQQAVTDFTVANKTAFQAAAGDVTTTDTPLLNQIVLGPVFEDLNYVRPVVAAVGARAMPDGGNQKTFIRPTWTTHTSVGVQASELGAVSATTPVIAANVVSKSTVSGAVTLSVQDIDFTSPGAMEIVLRDLAGQYLLKTDDIAADAIASGASASGSTWTYNTTDPSTLIAALYDAATDILSASNFLPDTIFVASGVWKLLGQQLDAEKRPVFPYAGAAGLMGVNGAGAANITVANTFNPFGLNLVADRNFAANTMIVAKASAIEFYEQVRGIMSVEVPGTLGRTFSYYGYVATFIADSDLVKSITVSP